MRAGLTVQNCVNSARFAICEVRHKPSSAPALWVGWPAPVGTGARAGAMNTRRMLYWWFRFVVSGRFIETFFNLRRERASRLRADALARTSETGR